MPERINASKILVVVGATALFVALFLDWYGPRPTGDPAISGWTAFELLDIVLAGIALAAIAAVLPVRQRAASATLVAGRWLPWLGIAALVLIAVSLINDPPGTRDRGLELGAWIGLTAAAMLAAGGLLTLARVSLVVTVRKSSDAPTAPLREESP